jgi:hypothetical protein
MPVIKPRTRGKHLVKHRTRLDQQNHEILYAYAHFLGESTEYVLNQLIDTVLAKDREFVHWRAQHRSRMSHVLWFAVAVSHRTVGRRRSRDRRAQRRSRRGTARRGR